MPLKFIALATSEVEALRAGGVDANGQIPEHAISDGNGNPCRHCLREISQGTPMLILAHRPFSRIQPYAELGPIFICGNPCERHDETTGVPDLYRNREMLIRGYDSADRIIYGTGQVLAMHELESVSSELFARADLSYLHARSPTNNCYHFRIENQAIRE
jgi:hypothetical protein